MSTATFVAAMKLLPLLGSADYTLVFSPLSLVHALAILCYLGKGVAVDELLAKLNLYAYDASKVEYTGFHLAANVFLKNMHLSQAAQVRLTKHFGCIPEPLVSAQQVNDWASKHTNGKIPHIVDDVSYDDALLLSALYFCYEFKTKFEPSLTYQLPFHSPRGELNVQMMNAHRKMPYAETDNAYIVELEYDLPGVVARVILPKSNYSLMDVFTEHNLAAPTLSNDVKFLMPKFRVESSFDLSKALKSVGCESMFNHVDCSESLGAPMLVSAVIYKALIEVDEKGTTAAAVTAVRMMRCAIEVPKFYRMVCDHPFWFVLMSQGEVLFALYYNG